MFQRFYFFKPNLNPLLYIFPLKFTPHVEAAAKIYPPLEDPAIQQLFNLVNNVPQIVFKLFKPFTSHSVEFQLFPKASISMIYFLLIIGDIEKGDLFDEECRNDR